jgi:hypothetical protein
MQSENTFNEDLVALHNDAFIYIRSVLKSRAMPGLLKSGHPQIDLGNVGTDISTGSFRISSKPAGSL